jgi:uncharacterized protein YrrD
MQFTYGAQVFTASGQDAGRITHVVLDPTTKTITHIVVRKGLLFAEEKVVPFELFAIANPREVTLRADAGDLTRLLPFRESYYITIETSPVANGDAPMITGGGWYLNPSAETKQDTTGWRGFKHVRREKENIPENTVALQERVRVISGDGQHVGIIESVLTRDSIAYATHVVIVSGLLVKTRKIMPTAWFRFIEADRIYLARNATRLQTLQEY